MLYKNEKAMFCSPDGNTVFVVIVTGVLQGDTLALYLFIICQDFTLETLIDQLKMALHLKKR